MRSSVLFDVVVNEVVCYAKHTHTYTHTHTHIHIHARSHIYYMNLHSTSPPLYTLIRSLFHIVVKLTDRE